MVQRIDLTLSTSLDFNNYKLMVLNGMSDLTFKQLLSKLDFRVYYFRIR